jgi:hypothetical protein
LLCPLALAQENSLYFFDGYYLNKSGKVLVQNAPAAHFEPTTPNF